jgi:xanthine dehydrogenase accessory factor
MVVLIRGGGDLASGVALRLYWAGFKILISELAQPLAVRRRVSFAEAIYAGETQIESVTARKVADPTDSLRVLQIFSKGQIPVLVDPDGKAGVALYPTVIVDARMTKRPPEPLRHMAKLYIGLGPGFIAGENCHVVIETNRGHCLGRVIWQGSAEGDTGVPEQVVDRGGDRVLHAPADGELVADAEIGDHLEAGQLVAEVAGQSVYAPFKGVLRGLAYPGLTVRQGLKIGDVDPRDDPRFCTLVSDKALAIGGGVLEAILSKPELRSHLWD